MTSLHFTKNQNILRFPDWTGEHMVYTGGRFPQPILLSVYKNVCGSLLCYSATSIISQFLCSRSSLLSVWRCFSKYHRLFFGSCPLFLYLVSINTFYGMILIPRFHLVLMASNYIKIPRKLSCVFFLTGWLIWFSINCITSYAGAIY